MSSSSRSKKTTAQQQTGAVPQSAANRKPARPSRPGGSSGGGQGTTSTMNADPEGQAIIACLDALRPLQQPGARSRVVSYVSQRYNLHLQSGWQGQAGEPGETQMGEGTQTGNESFIGTGQQQRTIGAGR